MRTTNSFRTLVCACLFVVVTILFCSASVIAESKTEAKSEDKTGGRFQVYMPNGSNASGLGAILLDTATGDTWRLYTYTDIKGEPMIWTPLDRPKTRAEIFQLGEKGYGWKTESSK